MSENTAIEWADHTFNPWVGCTKVSPACDNCYAETWAKRAGTPELWAGERRRTSFPNWKQPKKCVILLLMALFGFGRLQVYGLHLEAAKRKQTKV